MLPKDILSLNNAGISRLVRQKSILHITGISTKYIYFLQSGLVKVSHITNDGNEIIKYIIKPGSIFGELNLFDMEEDKNEIAIALENSEVFMIPAITIKNLMSTHQGIETIVNKSINKRIKQMEQRMLSLTLKDVKERIMDFLKDFALEFGHPVNGGFQVKNFLTHEDIAKITTTSRQSVSTTLGYFKKQGWIDYDTHNISVYKFQN